MKDGRYWVRIKGIQNGAWTVALFREGQWRRGDKIVPSEAVVQIGSLVVGPPL